MAAAVMGSAYSPPSPAGQSPDTTSPIYPDRPIRPLPKRRLRSRLSPEFADSIKLPPAPNVTKPLFYLPYNEPTSFTNGSPLSSEFAEIDEALAQAEQACKMDNTQSYHFKGNQLDSDDEDAIGTTSLRRYQELRQAKVSTPLRNYPNGASQAALAKLAKAPMSQSIASSVESVDGYDSFENTNNKKKRKIPTSGALGAHQSSLSAEMANMGISSARDMDPSLAELDAGVGQYHGTGTSAIPATPSGIGISGAGRGRYGRAARNGNGRSPLGVSINSSNAWQSGRSGPRRDYTSSEPPGTKDNILNQTPGQGIISAAIANAAALQTTSTKGQENASCLSEQQSARKSTPAKTQFTFTCESDSAKGMNWPVQHSPNSVTPHHNTAPPSSIPGQAAQGQRGFSTQGTQTSPNMASQPSQNRQQQQAGSNQQAPQQEKKPRRPPGKQYAMTARKRRLQQESNNYHHPPSGEDVWICEFCEYESIFGSPPEALVRQYEIKDRRERSRLDEKRRLLEKAKLKGRKGKKGNKNANNAAKNANTSANAAAAAAATLAHQPAGAAAAAANPQQQRYDAQQPQAQPADQSPMQQHQGTQSDDYLADDYDDDPVRVPAPPPSKIPQPVGQRYGQSVRSAAGYGTVQVGAGGGAA